MIEKSVAERIIKAYEFLESDNEEGYGITASQYKISVWRRGIDMWLDIMNTKWLISEHKLILHEEINANFIIESIQFMIEKIEEYAVNTKAKLAENLSVSSCAYCGSSLEDPKRKIQVERYIEHLTT